MRITDKGKLGREEGDRDRKGKQERAGEGRWFILSTVANAAIPDTKTRSKAK